MLMGYIAAVLKGRTAVVLMGRTAAVLMGRSERRTAATKNGTLIFSAAYKHSAQFIIGSILLQARSDHTNLSFKLEASSISLLASSSLQCCVPQFLCDHMLFWCDHAGA